MEEGIPWWHRGCIERKCRGKKVALNKKNGKNEKNLFASLKMDTHLNKSPVD
jgi:hypothetical protein